MAKIAVELQRAVRERTQTGAPGRTARRLLAEGAGWTVSDVVCTCGRQDRPFEEQHSQIAVAIVLAGSFQYRAESASGLRRELMTPGSLFLGNAGQYFECAHEHGSGDRCLSFQYTPDYFENLVADVGCTNAAEFRMLRLPPLRDFSPLVAEACAVLTKSEELQLPDVSWEEFGVRLAAEALRQTSALSGGEQGTKQPSAFARVARAIRMIEEDSQSELALGSLAREAGLSLYHFLRTFEKLTGVTPHQYVRRMRLREAALRLATEPARVLDIALDCGFGDVSNFNRAFRTEFRVNPREYRLQARGQGKNSITRHCYANHRTG